MAVSNYYGQLQATPPARRLCKSFAALLMAAMCIAIPLAYGQSPRQDKPDLIWTGHGEEPGLASDDLTWTTYRKILLAFQAGRASRAHLLAVCKNLLAAHPGSRYTAQWHSLVNALKHDAARGKPGFLKMPTCQWTSRQRIAYWIYALCHPYCRLKTCPRDAAIFGPGGPSPYQRLENIGPAAIGQLIDALNDDTPVRALRWQRVFYPCYFVVRREDEALNCLEYIAGVQFYEGGSTWMHFHMDTPQRRASVLKDIHTWWARSRGKSEAQMVRNQLALRANNETLRNGHDKVQDAAVLAMLVGPQSVIRLAKQWMADGGSGLNNPVVALMNRIDRPALVQLLTDRFWSNQSRHGDYATLFKYGNRRVYREIAARFISTGRLDPGSWTMGQQMQWAAKYGQNWSIPILARGLKDTKVCGSRSINNGRVTQSFSDADEAMEAFTKLIGRSFGYQRTGSWKARLAAIRKARHWWTHAGRAEMKTKIGANHPPVTPMGDLFADHRQIAACVRAIEGNDSKIRDRTIAQLTTVYSWRVQRALLKALARSDMPTEQQAILHVLARYSAQWMVPAFVKLFNDPRTNIAIKRLDVKVIQRTVYYRNCPLTNGCRLETREQGLMVLRRVLTSSPGAGYSISLKRKIADVLWRDGRWSDLQLLKSLHMTP